MGGVIILLALLGLPVATVAGAMIYWRAYGALALLTLGFILYLFFAAASVVYIGVPTKWW